MTSHFFRFKYFQFNVNLDINHTKAELYVVINPYTAIEGMDQLSVQQGDMCLCMDKSDPLFWRVKLNKLILYFIVKNININSF